MVQTLADFSQSAIDPEGRKVIVLGELKGLGMYTWSQHHQFLAPLRASGASHVFLCGQAFEDMCPILQDDIPATWGLTLNDIQEAFLQQLWPQDVIFMKGGREMAL